MRVENVGALCLCPNLPGHLCKFSPIITNKYSTMDLEQDPPCTADLVLEGDVVEQGFSYLASMGIHRRHARKQVIT